MSRRRTTAAVFAAAALVLSASCSTVDQPLEADLASPSPDIRTCATWFAALDAAIADAGVRDAEAHPIAGFPYLRVNRFLASFRTRAQSDDAAFTAWEARLQALDARSRGYEIQNLPTAAVAALGVADRTAAAERTGTCATVLAGRDAADPARRAILIERAQVPDDYADWKRTVGLYPLVRIPFFEFAKSWQNEASQMFDAVDAGKAPPHDAVRYAPSTPAASRADIAALFARTKLDTLGIPDFSPADAELLFASFAPVYDVETSGDYDRLGALHWANGRTGPALDAARPTVYRRLAFTRYGGETLVQVVYLIWFSERPGDSWLDPLSGNLDGLFFRVTLDATGQPLVYDTIHPCGCYHMFFPTPLARALPPADPRVEWAFIPRTLPQIAPPERLVLRLTSRSHYLTGIRVETPSDTARTRYTMADEGELRTLPTATGTRSIYGPTGIVPGTDRGERFAVWPLGIEEAGSMREWGRHATALVGRRQFDDADLIERRFALQPAPDGAGDKRLSER